MTAPFYVANQHNQWIVSASSQIRDQKDLYSFRLSTCRSLQEFSFGSRRPFRWDLRFSFGARPCYASPILSFPKTTPSLAYAYYTIFLQLIGFRGWSSCETLAESPAISWYLRAHGKSISSIIGQNEKIAFYHICSQSRKLSVLFSIWSHLWLNWLYPKNPFHLSNLETF